MIACGMIVYHIEDDSHAAFVAFVDELFVHAVCSICFVHCEVKQGLYPQLSFPSNSCTGISSMAFTPAIADNRVLQKRH